MSCFAKDITYIDTYLHRNERNASRSAKLSKKPAKCTERYTNLLSETSWTLMYRLYSAIDKTPNWMNLPASARGKKRKNPLFARC